MNRHYLNQEMHEVSALPKIDITKVDNNYEIKTRHNWFGKIPSWAPINVFNDGESHVLIQMPENFNQHDLPALFIVRHDGKKALVNYRIRNGWYIIDDLFQQAVLISGTGKHQQQVLIRYTGTMG